MIQPPPNNDIPASGASDETSVSARAIGTTRNGSANALNGGSESAAGTSSHVTTEAFSASLSVLSKVRADSTAETIHGIRIADPYRWLEDADSPETQDFVREQLDYARHRLDAVAQRARIRARLAQLLEIGTLTAPHQGGRFYFYTRREGGQNQPVFYVRHGVDGRDCALVDPNAMASDGTVALDCWYPSHDGRYVAYGTSQGGDEKSTLHVIEIRVVDGREGGDGTSVTGEPLVDVIEHTRACSLAWKPDDSGFYYTRYPAEGEVPEGEENYHRQVFYHALGADPAGDPFVFGDGERGDPQQWPNVSLSEDGRWLVISVEHGWSKTELFLKDVANNGPVVPIAGGRDFIYSGEVFRGTLYLRTNEDAPRFRMFAVPADRPTRQLWKEIIPQTDAVMQSAEVIGGRLVVAYERNAVHELKVCSLDGRQVINVVMPGQGSVFGIGGNWDSREVFYGFNSYTVPPTVYRYDFASSNSLVWAKVAAPGIEPDRYEVKQVWYSSKDKTRVPMFVIAKKGLVLDGRNPTLLTGYGGFNVSLTPGFNRGAYLWLENGGVYAVANLRGGAEFGEEWHRAGMLANKQNVFDDFIAAAEYLISSEYTDREHLAIYGGSNGGLLMGASMTQRPELFRAVVCAVPLLDMLRYQKFRIARLWIPEYGSSEDVEQFQWLFAYSPYHHVKDGVVYPATLFLTADSDSRVDPMHAKKMAAMLQAKAANGPDRPILLRVESKTGHGAGKPVAKLIEESTDVYSFLFEQLGVR
jgi:prolyl oligopeptidase